MAKAKRTPKRFQTACLCGRCGKSAEIRGLSTACYQAALRAIEAGDVNEQYLLDNGLMLPAYQSPRSGFRSALAECLARKPISQRSEDQCPAAKSA